MSRYRQIADVVRTRIQDGDYPIGGQLPAITAFQEEFDVRGINTVRSALQLLVEEGMLEIRQGVGTFVVSATSLREVDIVVSLTKAQDLLRTAIAAMTASGRSVTIDFEREDESVSFVLSDALREWASQQRFEASNESDELLREKRLNWASVAEALLERIEAAS